MQDLGHLLIPLELCLKVAIATQTRETPWSAFGVPRKGWLCRFCNRHPKITSRCLQGLEVARARSLCLATVETLYGNLENLYMTYNYPLVTYGIVMNLGCMQVDLEVLQY